MALQRCISVAVDSPVAVTDLKIGSVIKHLVLNESLECVTKLATIENINHNAPDDFNVEIERIDGGNTITQLITSASISEIVDIDESEFRLVDEIPDSAATADSVVDTAVDSTIHSPSIGLPAIVDSPASNSAVSPPSEVTEVTTESIEATDVNSALTLAKYELYVYSQLRTVVPNEIVKYADKKIASFTKKVEAAEEKEREKAAADKLAAEKRAEAKLQAANRSEWQKKVFETELGNGASKTVKPLAPDGAMWPSMLALDGVVEERISRYKQENPEAEAGQIKKERERLKLAAFSERIPTFATLGAEEYCGIFKAAKKTVAHLQDSHLKSLYDARLAYKRPRSEGEEQSSPKAPCLR
jgi:hypothetical protein